MTKALNISSDDDGRQLDLFGVAPPANRSAANGYAARSGSGPVGATCGGCTNYRTVQSGSRTHPKCALTRARWTRGPGSDIKRSAPACAAYSDQAAADRARLEPYLDAFALSIRAPWPTWIFGAGPDRKAWENRVWRPSFRPRYRGPILIHLSTWWDAETVCDTIADVGREWLSGHAYPMYAGIPDSLSTPSHLHALRGHLLGWVDLVDIQPAANLRGEFWVDEGGDSPPDHCALRLENPRLLPEPVPYRGKLGLFRVVDEAPKVCPPEAPRVPNGELAGGAQC